MACNQISGVTFNCLQNTGGVRAIYITNFENVTGTTANGVGTLTAVDMATGAYFQQFLFNRDTASIEEDASISLPNGTTFYTQNVSLMIPRREAAKRSAILVLADGQPKLAVIVQDQNGLYWFVGLVNGAYLSANKNGAGAKKGDANHYTLTITGEEPELAPEVDSAVISTIIQP